MAQKKYYELKNLIGASPELVTEYKKMSRRERYLEEVDSRHIVFSFGAEDELYSHFNIKTDYQIDPEKMKKIKMLYKALDMLRTEYEKDYKITIDYFFSSEKTSYNILAKKYGVSKQTIFNRIQRSILYLRGAMIEMLKSDRESE